MIRMLLQRSSRASGPTPRSSRRCTGCFAYSPDAAVLHCWASRDSFMRVMSRFILMTALLLVGTARTDAAVEDPMIVRLYELSQTSVMLQNATQKRNILKAMGQSMASPEAKGLDTLLDGVLEEADMIGLAKQYFAANLDFRMASRAVAAIEGTPHERLLVLEAAAGAPAEKEAFRSYIQDPGESASEDRVDLVSQIDELTLATEWMSTFIESLGSSIELRLQGLVASGKISTADYDASVTALRAQAKEYRDGKPGTLLLLYAYRDVSTKDLENYRDALEADEVRWFLRTSRQALLAAIKPSIDRFAENLSRLL
jgi:hypothetical protein